MKTSQLISRLQEILAKEGDLPVLNVEAISRAIDHAYKGRVWVRQLPYRKYVYKDGECVGLRSFSKKVVCFPVTGEPLS